MIGATAPAGRREQQQLLGPLDSHGQLQPGTYTFVATMDDGMRFWLDGRLLIDSWAIGQQRTLTTTVELTGGNHDLQIDYFDSGGVAVAQFSWQRQGSGGGGGSITFPNWKAQYWNNPRLEGQVQLTTDVQQLNQNWGLGSHGSRRHRH
ncbi:MAG: PA14 domain-containing protein [Chloroflexota bacterium]